jgi:starch-binding outer membrane protein, SusD/RagB family
MITRPQPIAARRPRNSLPVVVVVLALGTFGCGSLTNVEAPDVVQPDAMNNPLGAEAYTNTALALFNNALPNFVLNTALGSDEAFNANSVTGDANDQRLQTTTITYSPVNLGGTRRTASIAILLRRQHLPAPVARIGQMFAVKGLIEMLIGETACNGAPLSELKDYTTFEPIIGGPISSDSMLRRALFDFDSALTMVADSARILNYVRLGRGRTLLDLGRFADAAAAVAAVPTSYVYNVEVTTATGGVSNSVWNSNNGRSFTISNREGGNGLDYITANDPRVPTRLIGKGTDFLTDVYLFTNYTSLTSPIVFSSGLEARLIEAEAALNANHDDTRTTGTGWLGILNAVRAQNTPALPALADPGSFNARVDLLFRERAFWMFATGHRFGDMRRLLKQYGRTQSTVWPTGTYKGGVSYGNDVVFTLGSSELANPNVSKCTDMKP